MLQKLGISGNVLGSWFILKSGDFGWRKKFFIRCSRDIRFVDYRYLMILSAVGAEGLLS